MVWTCFLAEVKSMSDMSDMFVCMEWNKGINSFCKRARSGIMAECKNS